MSMQGNITNYWYRQISLEIGETICHLVEKFIISALLIFIVHCIKLKCVHLKKILRKYRDIA